MEHFITEKNGKFIIKINEDFIKFLFGCNSVIVNDIYNNIVRYAFYNTTNLCEVSFINGGEWMRIKVETGKNKDIILKWLMTYLENGMKEKGYATKFYDYDDFVLAEFDDLA